MPNSKVAIDFRLSGARWGECDLKIGGKDFTIGYISDSSDALGDLVRFALMIATGVTTATVRFEHEPAESRLWALNLGGRGGLFLKVLSGLDGTMFDHQGKIEFSAECDAADFANAVLKAAKYILDIYGVDGWPRAWANDPFPMRALRALETALATDDSGERLPPT